MSVNINKWCFIVFGFATMLLSTTSVYAQTITDAGGQLLNISKPFSRIISLYGAHTENLFSLGLDEEIIGVTKGDDFPAGANDKKRFSYREDAEKFIAARPDLVLIRPMIAQAYPQLIAKLQLTGITVVSLQPTNMEDTYLYWQQLGLLTGRESQATEMVYNFQQELEAIKEKVALIPAEKRRRVYFEAIHRKMKTFAPSSMTMFVLSSAGGINVAIDANQVRNTNIANYGKERILSHAHEIDVFLAQVGVMNKIDRQQLLSEPGFSAIKAVREDQVYIVDEKLVSRPTLRLLEGIGGIAEILYPKLF